MEKNKKKINEENKKGKNNSDHMFPKTHVYK